MNTKLLNIILALLIYLPTCVSIPLEVYFLLMGLTIYLNREFLKGYILNLIKLKVIDKNFTYILSFSLVALIFRLFDYQNWESIKDIYSFAYLFPFTYVIAKSVNTNVIKYVVYFLVFESVVSIVEYAYGVNTFFTFHKLYSEINHADLLYYTRVFGLSGNSSGLSIKLFIGVMLLNVLHLNKYKRIIFEVLMLTASVFVFGRIAIGAIIVFYLIKLISVVVTKNKFALYEFVSILLFVLFFSVNFTWTANQFTRNNKEVSTGRIKEHGGEFVDAAFVNGEKVSNLTEDLGIDKIEMSGRNEIWNSFFNFSIKNLFVGNKAKKYMLGTFHAHNSFLEVLSSFGLIMFCGLMLIFGFNLSKINYVYVLAFLFISLGQYVLFWGVSFFDIIFYYLIFHFKVKNEK